MKKLLVIVLILLSATTAFAFRINRPHTMSNPISEEQLTQLNSYLESVWNLQNGEFNFDITTTTKSGADNGDIWFVQTGSVIRLQFRANNHTFTITPDGF